MLATIGAEMTPQSLNASKCLFINAQKQREYVQQVEQIRVVATETQQYLHRVIDELKKEKR